MTTICLQNFGKCWTLYGKLFQRDPEAERDSSFDFCSHSDFPRYQSADYRNSFHKKKPHACHYFFKFHSCWNTRCRRTWNTFPIHDPFVQTLVPVPSVSNLLSPVGRRRSCRDQILHTKYHIFRYQNIWTQGLKLQSLHIQSSLLFHFLAPYNIKILSFHLPFVE